MEENYSDTEHIIVGKRQDKFINRIVGLRTLIFVLLAFGSGLSLFSFVTWNISSSNDILCSLAVTGLVTVFASIIGLYGCHKCLRHIEVVRTTKMKESPGQEALLIFFYFNYVLFCAFVLFGTLCFFYQDDATSWLEAKYSDKVSWEKDFKGIQLETVQNNIMLILTIAGICSLLVAIINFVCIINSLHISMAFETIHTIVQVQNLVVILIAFLIIQSGLVAYSFYAVQQVKEVEPEYLPEVLILTGVAMIMVAFLGYSASKNENKGGLTMYAILCGILMAIFLLFTVLLNFGSQLMETQFEDKCYEIMPYFHKYFYESFGCSNKYTQNSTSPKSLTCPKDQIVTIWETNLGIDVFDQSDFYGCLNEKCCKAMISVVKEKFNFLSAFCIVAFFFILVAIITSQYMRKKIKKFHAQILSHRNDKTLFILMIVFTVSLIIATLGSNPDGPNGWPQPKQAKWQVHTSYEKTYDLHVDREIIIGQLNEDGWWSFDMVALYYIDLTKCPDCVPEDTNIDVKIASSPANAKFKNIIDRSLYNQTMNININNSTGQVHFYGAIPDVIQALYYLQYQPGCILNSSNKLFINITYVSQQQSDAGTYFSNHTEIYKFNMNVNSGNKPVYRGKLVEENTVNPSGNPPYFITLANTSNVQMQVSLPFYPNCPSNTVQVDSHGIFEFGMSLLNYSIPYTMRIQVSKPGYQKIVVDQFVGGFPLAEIIELGSFAFFQTDNQAHNVSGRIFDAFTNKTLYQDYSLTIYQGYGLYNKSDTMPYSSFYFETIGDDYYTGFYEINNISAGVYTAVADSLGYSRNFQRFYALPSPPYTKQMRSLPMVPWLNEGQLALLLTWGYSPTDLDIHVEFIVSPTVLCKCDFSMHYCGGVRYVSDTIEGGDRGADVIQFDWIGDFEYIVYVSLFPSKNATAHDLTLAESQAELKVFAPYYSWPAQIFQVPAKQPDPRYTYWAVFCFSGKEGLKKLYPINQLTYEEPDVSTCSQAYGQPNAMKNQTDTEENP